ncbi:DUF4190 domain-containing protein [Streptomyces triticagri]|uniref:DUF4190 domain-containing protein n=1 Tax=Streptomyces triticagri TaxID=2293568 RepID=A0A372LXD6_9ACTN|nr:DUF4190 domain-containing protein [Streptomyces triticagri]RFU83316.1 DUF4190 domain-containing protein [Streptomyces triticagri]
MQFGYGAHPAGPGPAPYGPPHRHGHPGHPYGHPGYGHPYPAPPGYRWPGMQPPPGNGLGTTSLVLGIIAAVGFFLWPLAIVLGVLALVFGAIGRQKTVRGEANNEGVALAGIICGAVGLGLGVLMMVLAVSN